MDTSSNTQVAPANPAQVTELHGPFGWLNGHRALSEDSWTLESDPLENSEEYFAIPLYALTDPFKEIGKDFDGTLTAAIGAGGQAVQDTWFTDRALPVKAMSGDVEDNRVLRLHFRRPVTDDDRKAMCDALNLHQASLSQPHPADERVVEARDGFEAFSAMRDTINEVVPMQSAEADLLAGPELFVSCEAVALAVVSRVTALEAALLAIRETYCHSRGTRLPVIAQIDDVVSAALGGSDHG